MGILCALIGAACIYFLQNIIYRRFWNKNLTASIVFSQHAVTENEEGELRETIVNQKWLPLPVLKVNFETDRHLDFMDESNISVTDRCYKNDIFSLMMYQKITRRINFRCTRRGFYTITQINIDSTDLFMEEHLSMTASCSAQLYVYPGHVDAQRLLVPFQKIMGDLLTRRYTYDDPYEFQGVRPYQPFDSMRDVNWKASARTGELRTNIHGHTVRQEVCLLLNLESEFIFETKQLKEESIRLANSLAEMFLAQGVPVELYSNARDLISTKELRHLSGSGENNLILLHEKLARLDLSQPMQKFEAFINQKIPQKSGDILYVLISSSQRPEVWHAFTGLAQTHPGCLWILPLYPHMDQTIQSTEEFSIIRWEAAPNA